MYYIIVAIILVLALLLIGLVLLQPGKQSGLQGMANTGATQQLLGTRQSADILEKTTWGVVGLICLLSIFSASSMVQNNATKEVLKPGTAAPAAPSKAPAPKAPAPAAPKQ